MPSGTMLHVNGPATAMRCDMKCGVGARNDMIIEWLEWDENQHFVCDQL